MKKCSWFVIAIIKDSQSSHHCFWFEGKMEQKIQGKSPSQLIHITPAFTPGFIYLQGFEQNETGENGPPTPDLDNSNPNKVSVVLLK